MTPAPYFGPILTEEHWRASGDASAMEEFLGERGSPRRWRLFACHCCWRVLPLLTDERSREAVAVAARFAEGNSSKAEFNDALAAAHQAMLEAWRPGYDPAVAHAATAATYTLMSPRRVFIQVAIATGASHAQEGLSQCRLLRDLFGNPFRPFVLDSAWLSPTVKVIAESAYEREAFDELPILADALDDAGCNDESILAHLRDAIPHNRGCWALDAILHKA